jgi:hypothetical protein
VSLYYEDMGRNLTQFRRTYFGKVEILCALFKFLHYFLQTIRVEVMWILYCKSLRQE